MKRTIALGMSVALAMGGVATPAIAFAQTDNAPMAQQQDEEEKYEHIIVNKNDPESQRQAAIEKLTKALKLEYKGIDLLKNDGYVELPVKKQGGGFVYDDKSSTSKWFTLSGLKPLTKAHISFGFAHSDAISFEPNKENFPACTADYIQPSFTASGESGTHLSGLDGEILYNHIYFNTNFNGNTHVNDKATKFTIKEKWIIESADVWVKTSSAEHSIDTYSGKGVGKNGVTKTQLFKFLNGTEYDTNNTIRVDSSKRGNTELVYINWSGLKPNSSLNYTINTHHLPIRHKKFEVPRPLEEKPYIFTNEKVSEDGTYKKVFEIERYGNGQNISLKDVACDLSDETITLLKGKSNKEEPTKEYEKVLITNDGKENNSVEKKLAEHGVKLSISDKTAPCFEGDDCTMQTDELSVTGLKPNSIMSVYIITGDTGQTVQLEANSDGNAKKLFSYKSHDSENQVIWPVVKSFEGFLLKEKSVMSKENKDEYEHLSISQMNPITEEGLTKKGKDIEKLKNYIVSITNDSGKDLIKGKGKISLNEKGEGFVNIKFFGLQPSSEVSGVFEGDIPVPEGYEINGGQFFGKANRAGELETKAKIIATPLYSTSDIVQSLDVSKAEITAIDCWVKKNYTKPVENSVIQFKDPELKKRILSQMEEQKLITSDATEITEADALKVKKLCITTFDPEGVPIEEVQSLDGIENFKNLTDLDLSYTRISDIKPLAGLIHLTQLNLDGNQTVNITPLNGLTNLTTLNLSGNQIVDITALKGLTNLTKLRLDINEIIDITPLKGLTNLTDLDLYSNKISDIKPLTGLTNLAKLRFDHNQIADITPLKGLINLTKLSCSDNQISDITPLNGLTKLENINASRQIINLKSPTTKIDFAEIIKGFGGALLIPDENITNRVLTYKKGMKNPYKFDIEGNISENKKYSATVNVYFSDNKETEIQTDDISSELETLLNEYNGIKKTDNYKNADDNLKQAYDKVITDGKAVYDKLSSAPEQVKQAAEKIKTALEALNGDKKARAIKEQLSIATQKIASLQGDLEKAKQQNTTDKSKIDELTGKISTLNGQLEQMKQDKTKSVEEKQKEITKLNSQIEDLNKQVAQLTKDKDSLQQQLNKATESLSNVTVQLEQAKKDKQKADEVNQQAITTLNGQIAQLNKGKQDLQGQIDNKTQQITALNNQIEQVKQDKTKSEQEKQAEIDKLNGQIAQLNKDKQELQGKLDTATGNAQKLTAELEKAKQQGTADASTIANLNKQVSELQGKLEKLKSDKTLSDEQKQAEIDKLNRQIENLGKQVAQLTNDKKTLSEQLQQAQSNLADAQKKLQTATEQGVADKSKIEQLNGQISTLNGQLEKLKSDKTLSEQQKQAEIDKLNDQITGLSKQIEQLAKEKQSLQQQLDAATDNIKKLTGELDKAKEQGTADKSTIQSLNEQLQQVKNTLEQLKSDKTKSDDQKQKEIDQLNANITELGKQITQLTKDKENLTQQLQTIQQSLSDVQKKLQKAQEQGTLDANNIATLNQHVKTLNEQLNQLKQDKTKSDSEKQKEIDKLNGQIEELNKQVAQLTKDKSSLQQQLDTTNGKVQTLTDELNKAKQQGTADKATIERINGELQQAKQQLEQLKQDKTKSDKEKQAEINKLNGQIEELNKQIKGLSTRTRPENGSTILPSGNVVNPDGTVVLLDGNKIKPDGTITDSQDKPVDTAHATVDKDGNKVLPNGIKIKPNGDKELPDGVIIKNNGNVILPDGKVVYFAGGAIVAPLINYKPEFDLEKYKKEHPEEFNNSTPDNNSSNNSSSTGGGLSVTVINGNSGSGSTNTTDKKETPKEDTEKEKKEPVKQTPTTNTGAKATISFVTKAKDLIANIEKEVDEKLDKKDVSAVKATAIKTKLAELKQRLYSSTEDEAKPLVNELKQIKADLDKQRDSQKIEKTDNLHDKRVLDKDKQEKDKFPKTSDNTPIGAVGVMIGMLGILFGSKYKKAKHAKK